ncbi:MAG: hypothetical protein OXB92_14495 [Acidimicrobiaceae bacterium]|nr:hypothetical protein [Acidimicrobiia bacterium]MCY4495055.1 hypothetical protein [Acidimicrobiaceae bacterium]
MSSAVGFLAAAVAIAIVGSLLLWLWHSARSKRPPTFQEHLQALAPRGRPAQVEQPSGIVAFDPDSGEELSPGT